MIVLLRKALDLVGWVLGGVTVLNGHLVNWRDTALLHAHFLVNFTTLFIRLYLSVYILTNTIENLSLSFGGNTQFFPLGLKLENYKMTSVSSWHSELMNSTNSWYAWFYSHFLFCSWNYSAVEGLVLIAKIFDRVEGFMYFICRVLFFYPISLLILRRLRLIVE